MIILELYLRLLIAGTLSIMVQTVINYYWRFLKFIVVGWRITKPPTENDQDEKDSLPELSALELLYNSVLTILCLAVFVTTVIKIDIFSMPESLKPILALSFASLTNATAYVYTYGSYRNILKNSKFWSRLPAPLYFILWITLSPIIYIPFSAYSVGVFIYRLIRARKAGDTQLDERYRRSRTDVKEGLEKLTAPQRMFLNNLISFIVLGGAYWLFGFRSNLLLFLLPAFLLVIVNRMFLILLYRMSKLDDPSELRAINPVVFASTVIILFSFYIAILLNHPEHTSIYLGASALFLMALWYFSYLSRRETTIEVGRESHSSKDYDFQVKSSDGMLAIFSSIIWFLHPIFFAFGLLRYGGLRDFLFAETWFNTMKVSVALTILFALTCLFVWTRNIRAPKLTIAGTDQRPDYPEFRDNLAASALPYCVVIPALVYALLNLLGLSPIRLPGLEVNLWLDISIYVALTLLLIGLFVQLPYRSGARQWKSPELERLENQIKQITKDIDSRRDDLLKSKGSVAAMKNISDELTLSRLRSEIESENKQKKLNYNIAWPGEIGKDSALYFVLSFVASAITTAIATNLDTITKLLLKLPK